MILYIFVDGAGFFSTSFIPHFGQLPGLSLITSGCMVQVYTLSTFFFTRVIPHLGQLPGLSVMTSGCMGQVYIYFDVVADLLSGVFDFDVCAKENVAPVNTNARMNSFFIF
jgi:hypothetical protein